MRIIIPGLGSVGTMFKIMITILVGVGHSVFGQHGHILLHLLQCYTITNSLNWLWQVCL